MPDILPVLRNAPSVTMDIWQKDDNDQKFCNVDVSPAIILSLETGDMPVTTLEKLSGIGNLGNLAGFTYIWDTKQFDAVATCAYLLGLVPYDPYVNPFDLQCVSHGVYRIRHDVMELLSWYKGLSAERRASIACSLSMQLHQNLHSSRPGRMPSVKMCIVYNDETHCLRAEHDVDVSRVMFLMFEDDPIKFDEFRYLIESTRYLTNDQFQQTFLSSDLHKEIGVAAYANGLVFNRLEIDDRTLDVTLLEAREIGMDRDSIPCLREDLEMFFKWFFDVTHGGLCSTVISDIRKRIVN